MTLMIRRISMSIVWVSVLETCFWSYEKDNFATTLRALLSNGAWRFFLYFSSPEFPNAYVLVLGEGWRFMLPILLQIPVNVIYYGARGTDPWKVDPTQHLGFLFTLLGFTVATTPAVWGIIKQYVMLYCQYLSLLDIPNAFPLVERPISITCMPKLRYAPMGRYPDVRDVQV